jgi:hypothetical protein
MRERAIVSIWAKRPWRAAQQRDKPHPFGGFWSR